jgi:ABC-type multidrug transport system fused ATPase/permease subunit
VLRALYATTSPRLRAVVGVTTAISVAGKVVAVILAERVVGGDLGATALLGAVGFALYAVARILTNGARVDAQCELQRTMARAIVECDVLTEPTPEPLRALFEPAFNARTLVTDVAPELVASALAALAVAPVVSATLPPRALLVSAIALGVVLAAIVSLGRASVAVQQRVWDVSQHVLDQVALAVEGRVELVARGADGVALRGVNAAIERYRAIAKRGAWASAMLGRAPLAAGLLAIVVAVILDATFREAITGAVFTQALVLVACLPIVLGVVLKANELVRLSTTIGPVLDVLEAPRRVELARGGVAPPSLPTSFAMRDVTFSYEREARPTLRGLSFEWPAGGALFVDGPNGAGKSTLLRLLLGLRTPQEGSVTVGGVDLADVDLPRLRQGIAYLPQRPYLGEVYATVRSALVHAGTDGVDVPDGTMRAALERVGLSNAARSGDLLEVPVGQLSAGQRQRLALARILLHEASVYLLDEPDANLDRAGIALVGEIVRELVAAGRMVAIAAHTSELDSIPGIRVSLG